MSQNRNEIEFDWIVEESKIDEEANTLKKNNIKVTKARIPYEPQPDEVDDYADASFEPMLMITGVATAVFLIQQIIRMWKDRSKSGGVVIDARKNKLRVRKVPSLNTGELVVISTSGTSVHKSNDENGGLTELKKVLGV
jgi:hypothetical protein